MEIATEPAQKTSTEGASMYALIFNFVIDLMLLHFQYNKNNMEMTFNVFQI